MIKINIVIILWLTFKNNYFAINDSLEKKIVSKSPKLTLYFGCRAFQSVVLFWFSSASDVEGVLISPMALHITYIQD